ncbi:MAG: hypothetical protein H7Y15_17935, partial [Pseudonocardia sp.]|nr:hypothetical protein [Pseudonocardia sp.]
PRLTAERFRPDPRGGAGERLYLTGDTGRLCADGRLRFGGRRDGQVKLRGFRVELGEIEAVIVSHPDVLAAAVAVRGLPPGEDGVVVWVMMAGAPDPGDIRRYLAQRLPRHMVPARIVTLDRMPTTAHGKIDRAALPMPELVADHDQVGGPADDPETAVRRLFADTLMLAEVTADDDFFHLGGDSMRFVRLVSRVNDALGVRLPLRQAMQQASPRGLAELAAGTPDVSGEVASVPSA